MIKLIILFTVCTAINVVLSTIRSIMTVKGSKMSASLTNAICYGFYTWVIVLTSGDGIPLWQKMLITAICNFIGVWIVKAIEEKRTPEKLWKVEITLPCEKIGSADYTKEIFEHEHNIPCNYTQVGNWWAFNCYCENGKQVDYLKDICMKLNGKISAYESKTL